MNMLLLGMIVLGLLAFAAMVAFIHGRGSADSEPAARRVSLLRDGATGAVLKDDEPCK
jgi:hypothetical protein